MSEIKVKDAFKNSDLIWNRLLELAEARRISVYLARFGSRLNGFYFNSGEMKVIGIRNNLPEHRKKFVLAHELGHAVLHSGDGDLIFAQSDDDRQRIKKAEVEADRFAKKLIRILAKKESGRLSPGRCYMNKGKINAPVSRQAKTGA